MTREQMKKNYARSVEGDKKFLLGIVGLVVFCFGGPGILLGILFLCSVFPFPLGIILFLGILIFLGSGWGRRGRTNRVYEPTQDAGGL